MSAQLWEVAPEYLGDEDMRHPFVRQPEAAEVPSEPVVYIEDYAAKRALDVHNAQVETMQTDPSFAEYIKEAGLDKLVGERARALVVKNQLPEKDTKEEVERIRFKENELLLGHYNGRDYVKTVIARQVSKPEFVSWLGKRRQGEGLHHNLLQSDDSKDIIKAHEEIRRLTNSYNAEVETKRAQARAAVYGKPKAMKKGHLLPDQAKLPKANPAEAAESQVAKISSAGKITIEDREAQKPEAAVIDKLDKKTTSISFALKRATMGAAVVGIASTGIAIVAPQAVAAESSPSPSPDNRVNATASQDPTASPSSAASSERPASSPSATSTMVPETGPSAHVSTSEVPPSASPAPNEHKTNQQTSQPTNEASPSSSNSAAPSTDAKDKTASSESPSPAASESQTEQSTSSSTSEATTSPAATDTDTDSSSMPTDQEILSAIGKSIPAAQAAGDLTPDQATKLVQEVLDATTTVAQNPATANVGDTVPNVVKDFFDDEEATKPKVATETAPTLQDSPKAEAPAAKNSSTAPSPAAPETATQKPAGTIAETPASTAPSAAPAAKVTALNIELKDPLAALVNVDPKTTSLSNRANLVLGQLATNTQEIRANGKSAKPGDIEVDDVLANLGADQTYTSSVATSPNELPPQKDAIAPQPPVYGYDMQSLINQELPKVKAAFPEYSAEQAQQMATLVANQYAIQLWADTAITQGGEAAYASVAPAFKKAQEEAGKAAAVTSSAKTAPAATAAQPAAHEAAPATTSSATTEASQAAQAAAAKYKGAVSDQTLLLLHNYYQTEQPNNPMGLSPGIIEDYKKATGTTAVDPSKTSDAMAVAAWLLNDQAKNHDVTALPGASDVLSQAVAYRVGTDNLKEALQKPASDPVRTHIDNISVVMEGVQKNLQTATAPAPAPAAQPPKAAAPPAPAPAHNSATTPAPAPAQTQPNVAPKPAATTPAVQPAAPKAAVPHATLAPSTPPVHVQTPITVQPVQPAKPATPAPAAAKPAAPAPAAQHPAAAPAPATNPTNANNNVAAITQPIKGASAQTVQHAITVLEQADGLTPLAAAVVTGNLIQESGLNPKAVGDGGAAKGIIQAQGARQDGMPSTLDGQLIWAIQKELPTHFGGTTQLKQLQDPNTTEAQLDKIMLEWEQPADPGARKQLGQALAQNLAKPTTPTAPKASSPKANGAPAATAPAAQAATPPAAKQPAALASQPATIVVAPPESTTPNTAPATTAKPTTPAPIVVAPKATTPAPVTAKPVAPAPVKPATNTPAAHAAIQVQGGAAAAAKPATPAAKPAQPATPARETVNGAKEPVKVGAVKYVSQKDESLANVQYGHSGQTIATSGCVPTAQGMIIATLKGGDPVTAVKQAAQYNEQHGYRTPNDGTANAATPAIMQANGLKAQTISPTNPQAVLDAVNKGAQVLVTATVPHDSPDVPGTSAGHAYVITSNGKGGIKVADPKDPTKSDYTIQQALTGATYAVAVTK